jgi:putative phosphoesterase
MKILVISDIHGNLAALDAVTATPHDAVICLGDIVGYGPDPRGCLQWVREHANWVVQGNHDRAIGDGVPPRCQPDFAWLADAVTPWTRELEKVPANLLLVGHTHLPLDLRIDQQRVINPGSVGQPKDGDPRASFAMIVDGEPQPFRVAYDVEATVSALEASDVATKAVGVLSEMLRTGKAPRTP